MACSVFCIRHVFYNICSGALQAAITVIAACGAPLPNTFVMDSTLNDHTTSRDKFAAIYTSCYNSGSGTTQAAITVIAACRAPLPHTFAVDSTLTDHSTAKGLLTLKTCLCFLKSEGPLKKNIYQSEQWQVINCRLIPLLTHVSFCYTVPLKPDAGSRKGMIRILNTDRSVIKFGVFSYAVLQSRINMMRIRLLA
jgi:hypothetical protein